MSPEKQLSLYERYPMLFSDAGKGVCESPMAFGIECGDGWFDLLNDACSQLEALNAGRAGGGIVAEQVKEKFGTLRFYARYPNDVAKEAEDVLCEAEGRSSWTCEACGKPGKCRNVKFWLTTLCDKCREERQRERREPADVTLRGPPK